MIDNHLDNLRTIETENTKELLEVVLKEDHIDWEALERYIRKYDKLLHVVNNILSDKKAAAKKIYIKTSVKNAVVTALKKLSKIESIYDGCFTTRPSDIRFIIMDNGLCDLDDFGGKNIESKIGIILNEIGFIHKTRDRYGMRRVIDIDTLNKLYMNIKNDAL